MPQDTPRPDRSIPEGVCRGGPLDGCTRTSRFPRGFLAVDRPNERAWLYDWDPDAGEFRVREEGGRELDHNKRMHAALADDEFDVHSAVL